MWTDGVVRDRKARGGFGDREPLLVRVGSVGRAPDDSVRDGEHTSGNQSGRAEAVTMNEECKRWFSKVGSPTHEIFRSKSKDFRTRTKGRKTHPKNAWGVAMRNVGHLA